MTRWLPFLMTINFVATGSFAYSDAAPTKNSVPLTDSDVKPQFARASPCSSCNAGYFLHGKFRPGQMVQLFHSEKSAKCTGKTGKPWKVDGEFGFKATEIVDGHGCEKSISEPEKSMSNPYPFALVGMPVKSFQSHPLTMVTDATKLSKLGSDLEKIEGFQAHLKQLKESPFGGSGLQRKAYNVHLGAGTLAVVEFELCTNRVFMIFTNSNGKTLHAPFDKGITSVLSGVFEINGKYYIWAHDSGTCGASGEVGVILWEVGEVGIVKVLRNTDFAH